MQDRFERSVDYLRISVTDRCNLRCTYCMPEDGVEKSRHDEVLSFEQIYEVASVASRLGFTKIRLTGGEPLVRRGIVELVRLLAGIPALEKLAMTTNAILLPRFAAPLREAGLTAVNVSLDTLDRDRYREITRGGSVDQAIAGVDSAIAAGFSSIKVNVVVSPESTQEELEGLAAFCADRGILLQRIRQYSLSSSKLDVAGYDRPPVCADCNRLRLTANGYLKPCLHSDLEIPVDFADVEGSIRRAVAAKPYRGASCSNRSMIAIGG